MSEHAVQISTVVARPVIGLSFLVVLGETSALAVLLALVVLLTIFHEPALSLPRGTFAFAFDHLLDGLSGRGFVQLLDESSMRAWAMLPLGVH